MEHIVLLGGDARMRAAAEAFRGMDVRCFWMEHCPCPTGEQLKSALSGADVLILPTPALTQDGRLPTVCPGPAPLWADLRGCLKPGCLVCGGGLHMIEWPRKADLLADEAFAAANAIPAALAV